MLAFWLSSLLCVSAQWTLLNSTVTTPSARSGHSLLAFNNTLVLFGGCAEVCYSDVQLYSISEGSWRRLATTGATPPAREGHSANIVSSVMYVFGGASTTALLNDLWAFDLVTYVWSEIRVAGTVEPRSYHGSALTNSGNIVMFGGQTNSGLTNEVLILDLLNRHWGHPSLSGTRPSPRKHHSLQRVHNAFWTFGGFDGSKETQDLYRLDLEDLSWREIIATGGPLPRQGHASTSNGNQLYISAGCNTQSRYCYSDLYSFDVDAHQWTQTSNSSFLVPRESHAVAILAGRIYVFGGSFFLERLYSDLVVYNTGTPCPNQCGSGKCTETGCSCQSGWTGTDCGETAKCRYGCYGRGQCSQLLQCECYPGYTGPYCQYLTGCPLNCTSETQGTCLQSGNCRCKDGYTGEDCAVPEPWRRCLDRCVHGTCQSSDCVCDNGWIGTWCDLFSPVLYEPNHTRVRVPENLPNLPYGEEGPPVEVGSRSRQSAMLPLNTELSDEQIALLNASFEGAEDTLDTLSDENAPHEVTHEMFGLTLYNAPTFYTSRNARSGRRVTLQTPDYIEDRIDDEKDWDGLDQCDDYCSYHGICSDDDCYCEHGYTGDRCEKEDDDLHSNLRLSMVLKFDFFLVYIGCLIYGAYKLRQIMKRIQDSERNKFPESTN